MPKASEFIRKINEADYLARLFKDGYITALELEEKLIEHGFFDISFVGREIKASINCVKLELGNHG
jgi:hypothetical protein